MRIITNILISLVFILVLVWPMPHIIAIRNIDIGLIFLISGFIFLKSSDKVIKFDKYIKYLGSLLIVFFLWIIIISYISNFSSYCFKEMKQFGELILLGFSAYFMINSKVNYEKIFLTIFIGFMIFPTYHCLYSFHYYLLYKHLPFRSHGITVGLDELNFMMPYILTFFSVEIIFRFLNKKSLLKISNSVLSILLFMVLFSLFVQAKRNGIVSICFMIISIIFFIKLVSQSISKKFVIFALVGVFIGGSLLFLDIKYDKRWDEVFKSLKVVFVQDNMAYLNGKVPDHLGASNYKRMFYVREGIRMIIKNPWGYGYGREIFGKVLSKEYDVNVHTHAHSGMIDWGIGLGIPGLLLWSFMIFILIYIGFKAFIRNESYFGLFLVYLSTSFYFRNFLDSMNKDHMFQQFIFLVCLSLFIIYKEQNEKNNLSSS